MNAGETDLRVLLRDMRPDLDARPFGFGQLADGVVPQGLEPFATVAEAEGLTVIAPVARLAAAGVAHAAGWARISLGVQSSLAAVGLTAAVATALAARGISANMVAGLRHDHIFVPWERREEAMAALAALGR
jgi:hypothetical protein